MSASKLNSPAERAEASAKAKQAMLERFKARPSFDDPAVQQRQAELKAIADARAERDRERREAKAAEAARIAAEKAAAIARQKAEAAAEAAAAIRRARDAAAAEQDYKARALAKLAEQKAARDARYAKRKAK